MNDAKNKRAASKKIKMRPVVMGHERINHTNTHSVELSQMHELNMRGSSFHDFTTDFNLDNLVHRDSQQSSTSPIRQEVGVFNEGEPRIVVMPD